MTNIICQPGGPIGANTYFIYDDDKNAVLIDPTDFSVADRLVLSKGIIPIAVLLTHGHFDHTFAQSEIKAKYGIKSYLHDADFDIISDTSKNGADLMGNTYIDRDFGTADVRLYGGEVLNFGKLTFVVHHTPGHTDGSACYELKYADNRTSALFCGDTLFRLSAGRCDLYSGSDAKMRQSLDYISKLDNIDKIYPGHGFLSSLDFELKSNPFLKQGV